MTVFTGRGYSLVSFAKWKGLGRFALVSLCKSVGKRFLLVLLFKIKDLLGLHKIKSFLSFKCLL